MRLKSIQNVKRCRFCQLHRLKRLNTSAGRYISWRQNWNVLMIGNILNMFEIRKYWNKISQKDGYLHSKIHCLTLSLLCNVALGTLRFFSAFFCYEISFCYEIHVCVVNKTKFIQVLRKYTHLSKSYKPFVTCKLIYFWNQDD